MYMKMRTPFQYEAKAVDLALDFIRTCETNSGVTIKAKSRWGGNKSITKVVIYQNVGLGLKFTGQPA